VNYPTLLGIFEDPRLNGHLLAQAVEGWLRSPRPWKSLDFTSGKLWDFMGINSFSMEFSDVHGDFDGTNMEGCIMG